jgi:DNA polymerase III delta prime subunit
MPAWPWKGMVHIRGDTEPMMNQSDHSALPVSSRKSKGNAVGMDSQESVLWQMTTRLRIPDVLAVLRDTNTDDFLPPPTELRLPGKHFESGRKLQQRISSQITSRGRVSSPLYGSIQSSLSTFDRSDCETQAWTQKYAPGCAADVLQLGGEPSLLRDWLKALKVQAVDTGASETLSSTASKKGTKGGKPKTKRKKLEGFVVSSDEEADEMDELSDSDTDWTANIGHGATKRTVIRAGDAAAMASKSSARLTNAIVISGPHGCGKTAAVYAAAKELDFEVFEINAGSRRSGKDILEKIGDMTTNHLVQHHQEAKTAASDVIPAEDVAKDIISGKQATMGSFFKAKAPAQPTTTKLRKPVVVRDQPTAVKKALPKSQKQSLILLEEIDILYEEDKQFWATVVGLITQSKRPFIMTCNNEHLVPFQTLRLHGIFRFSPPPKEDAVDRLLLIAANEGHALQRAAVETLYDCRDHDFRAALMDLNYWCQIGIGDRRGGFDWFYLRWPRGVDVDEDGHVVRVVSENTYPNGMGILCRELLEPDLTDRDYEEKLLLHAWDTSNIDLDGCFNSVEVSDHAEPIQTHAQDCKEGRLAALEKYDRFADAMSAADLTSCSSFATGTEECIDPTLPSLPGKVRDDFILGLEFLDAPVAASFNRTSLRISTTLRTRGRHLFQHQAPRAGHRTDTMEEQYINRARHGASNSNICRLDFAHAFDPIAAPEGSLPAAHLDPSVFDRNLAPIVLDVAPYVRSIVAYEARLARQRLKLSNLVSEGGRGPKRMRTTRAALSALEGGARSATRKERWFKADLNSMLVAKTAGTGWEEAVVREMEERDEPVADVEERSELVAEMQEEMSEGDSDILAA